MGGQGNGGCVCVWTVVCDTDGALQWLVLAGVGNNVNEQSVGVVCCVFSFQFRMRSCFYSKVGLPRFEAKCVQRIPGFLWLWLVALESNAAEASLLRVGLRCV